MKNNIQQLVRSNILNMTSYSSARDEYKNDEGIFLDANESPYGNVNRYPDPYQRTLKRLLAESKNIDIENIFVGNGSDEAIDLLFRIFCRPGQDKSISFSPGYGMYEVSAAIQDIEHINLQLDNNFQIDKNTIELYLSDEPTKLLFICSPNNPTGNSIKSEDILWLLDNFQGILVIDEAYIDFSEQASWLSDINNYDRLVILQTMSKAWGLAGARVGMAYSNPDIITLLNKVKPPYNVSALNQKEAIKAVSNKREAKIKIKAIVSQRKRLEKELLTISIIDKIYPSETNFLLIKVKEASKIYKELIDQQIIVRNQTKKIEGCLRISIGTPEENNRLLDVLKILSDSKSKIAFVQKQESIIRNS